MPAFATVLQQAALFFVLNQDDRNACYACLGAQAVDEIDDTFDLEAFVLADAQQMLDVDDQQCSGHGDFL
ncbi:hypothetical protein D3C86_2020070 [compost metagenome]